MSTLTAEVARLRAREARVQALVEAARAVSDWGRESSDSLYDALAAALAALEESMSTGAILRLCAAVVRHDFARDDGDFPDATREAFVELAVAARQEMDDMRMELRRLTELERLWTLALGCATYAKGAKTS